MFKSLSLYMLSMLLPQVMGFIMLPILANHLTPEEYGIYAYTTTINGFLFILSNLGFHAFYLREYYQVEDTKLLNGTLFWFLVCYNAFLLIVLAVVLNWCFKAFNVSVSFFPYMFYAVISQFFLSFEIIPIRTFRIRKDVDKYFLSIVLRTILVYVLNVLFVVMLKVGVLGRYYADIIAFALFSLYYIYYMTHCSVFRIDFSIIKQASRFTRSIIPADLLQMLVNRGDRIIIEKLMTVTQTGLFSIGSTVSGVSYSAVLAFYQAIEPDIFKHAKSDEFSSILLRLKRVFMILAFCGSVGISLFAEEIIKTLTPEGYWGSVYALKFLAMAIPFSAINLIVYLLAIVDNKLYVKFVSYAIGAVVCIGLNVLLIPVWELNGAGIAKIVSVFSILMAGIVFLNKGISLLRLLQDFWAYLAGAALILGVYAMGISSIRTGVIVKAPLFMFYCMALLFIYGISIRDFYATVLVRLRIR